MDDIKKAKKKPNASESFKKTSEGGVIITMKDRDGKVEKINLKQGVR